MTIKDSNMIKRVGFACKYMHHDQSLKPKILKEVQGQYNERTTTITWLNRQSRDVAEQRLHDCTVANFQNALRLVQYVGSLPHQQRMVRLGSNMMPAYTHDDWSYFYKQPDILNIMQRGWARVGEEARKLDVRLSMHPGQFCVLASDNPDIVEKSIEEFEYHADIIRWMGYGVAFQDFKCNVHISGRQGPEGIIRAYKRLSPEARNTLTIENDENSWGLDASMQLPSYIPLVLDIHHHWCHSGGEYIEATDDRVKRVIESWRGVRPAMHYSVSREDLLVDHPTDQRPDFQKLLEQGFKKAKLRAHSDYMWNTACNEWASSFRDYFDIMVEAKCKNLASIPLEESGHKYLNVA